MPPEEIFCILDTTLFNTLKNGIIFTLHGLYILELFGKTFYLNYADIDSIQVIPNKNGKGNQRESQIRFFLKDGLVYSLADTNIFDKYILSNIIDCLRCADKTWNFTSGHKNSGETAETRITEEQKSKCEIIIHGASVAAGGVGTGLAQIPVIDTAVITPIQIGMITALGAVFEIRVTEGMAKGIITSLGAAVVGRGVSQLLLGWVPGLGNAINTATATGLTEAIGWAAVTHFCDLNEKDRAKYRVDGMQAGYEAASDEYEEKLQRQKEAFIKDRDCLRKNHQEYKDLCREYEAYIEELMKENDKLKTSLLPQVMRDYSELLAVGDECR